MKWFGNLTAKSIARAKINIAVLYFIGFILAFCGFFDRFFFYTGLALIFFATIAAKGLYDWNHEKKYSKKLSTFNFSSTGFKEWHHMNFQIVCEKPETRNSSGQKLLRDIKFHEEPFAKIESVELSPYDHGGSIQYSILINGKRIGTLPKEDISEYEEYKSLPMEIAMVDIFGGETRSDGEYIPYSCRIVLRFKLVE